MGICGHDSDTSDRIAPFTILAFSPHCTKETVVYVQSFKETCQEVLSFYRCVILDLDFIVLFDMLLNSVLLLSDCSKCFYLDNFIILYRLYAHSSYPIIIFVMLVFFLNCCRTILVILCNQLSFIQNVRKSNNKKNLQNKLLILSLLFYS